MLQAIANTPTGDLEEAVKSAAMFPTIELLVLVGSDILDYGYHCASTSFFRPDKDLVAADENLCRKPMRHAGGVDISIRWLRSEMLYPKVSSKRRLHEEMLEPVTLMACVGVSAMGDLAESPAAGTTNSSSSIC